MTSSTIGLGGVFSYAIFLFYATAVVVVLCFALAAIISAVRSSQWNWARFFLRSYSFAVVSLPFLLISFSIGFLSGVSNQPTVAAIIPAVLSFIGGIFAYVVSSRRRMAGQLGFAICVFSVSMVYSISVGAQLREGTRLDRLKYLSQQEQRIRFWRKNRGLPEMFPDWILGAEEK